MKEEGKMLRIGAIDNGECGRCIHLAEDHEVPHVWITIMALEPEKEK